MAELMKKGRKPKYPEKTPGDELQNMPHTKAQRLKARDSSLHNINGVRLEKQTCKPLHHASPLSEGRIWLKQVYVLPH